jgi:hypothetical protein
VIFTEMSPLLSFLNVIPDVQYWQQKIENEYQSSQIGIYDPISYHMDQHIQMATFSSQSKGSWPRESNSEPRECKVAFPIGQVRPMDYNETE